MKWVPITPETVIPPGTQLLGLRRRGPFSADKAAGWDTIDAVIVQRIGSVCGKQHPDADEIGWYGTSYQFASRQSNYSHYILLSDLPELPPLPEPTEEDIAREWERQEQNAAAGRRFAAALKAVYPAAMGERLLGVGFK